MSKVSEVTEEWKDDLRTVHEENRKPIIIHDVKHQLLSGIDEPIIDMDYAIKQRYEKGNWDYVKEVE